MNANVRIARAVLMLALSIIMAVAAMTNIDAEGIGGWIHLANGFLALAFASMAILQVAPVMKEGA